MTALLGPAPAAAGAICRRRRTLIADGEIGSCSRSRSRRTLGSFVRQQPAAPDARRARRSVRPAARKAATTSRAADRARAAVDWRAPRSTGTPIGPGSSAGAFRCLPTRSIASATGWSRSGSPAGDCNRAAKSSAPIDHDWFYHADMEARQCARSRQAGPGRAREPGAGSVLVDRVDLALRLCDERCMAAGLDVTFDRSRTRVSSGSNDAHAVVDPTNREDWASRSSDRLQQDGRLPRSHACRCGVSVPDRAVGEARLVEGRENAASTRCSRWRRALGDSTLPHPIHIGVVTNQLHNYRRRETSLPASATLLWALPRHPAGISRSRCPASTSTSRSVGDRTGSGARHHCPAPRRDGRADASSRSSATAGDIAGRRATSRQPAGTGAGADPAAPRRRLPDYRRHGQDRPNDGPALAESVQAKLVLIGRSDFPARNEWDGWLDEHEASDRVSNVITTLLSLEETGAEVLLLRADVTDLKQMRQVVKHAVQRFGAINGVIHTAGLVDFHTIPKSERELCRSGLRPEIARHSGTGRSA